MVLNRNQDNTAFHIDVNNSSIANYNGWLSGFSYTLIASTEDISISSGELLYQGEETSITGSSVTVSTGDTSFNRIDIIGYNGTNVVIMEGSASAVPKPSNYNVEDFYPLYIVHVPAGSTSSSSYTVEDFRVYAGSQGGGIQSKSFTFTSEDVLILDHNLNDNFVTVQVYDNNNDKVEPGKIRRINSNTVRIELSVTTSGTVTVLGRGEFIQPEGSLPAANVGVNFMLRTDGTNYVLDSRERYFVSSSDTFPSGQTSYVVTNSNCKASSLPTISVTQGDRQTGVWSVESEEGQFTVTSDEEELQTVTFDYFIQN